MTNEKYKLFKINVSKTNVLVDEFLNLSKLMAIQHPAIVVILMHEYFRSLYPSDPYIESRYDDDHLLNIKKCLENNIIILKHYDRIGSYINGISEDVQRCDTGNDITRISNLFTGLWGR